MAPFEKIEFEDKKINIIAAQLWNFLTLKILNEKNFVEISLKLQAIIYNFCEVSFGKVMGHLTNDSKYWAYGYKQVDLFYM